MLELCLREGKRGAGNRSDAGRNDLGGMDWSEVLDRFDFNDRSVLHHKVDPVATVELSSPVDQRQKALALISAASLAQFTRQAVLINCLKQPWARLTVYFNCCANSEPTQIATAHNPDQDPYHAPMVST